MAAGRGQDQNAMGRKGRPGLPAERIPAPSGGKSAMEKSERTVELLDRPGRNACRSLRWPNSRTVRRRVEPVGRRQAARSRKRAVVRPHVRRPDRLERRPDTAPLRRRRLESRRLGQRRAGRQPHGRLCSVHVRRDGSAAQERRKHVESPGLGPDRARRAAARQADVRPRRNLVHAGQRDLADGLARTGSATIHRRAADDARHRPPHAAHRSRRARCGAERPDRSDGHGRRANGRYRRGPAGRGGRSGHAGRYETVESRLAFPVRPAGNAQIRQGNGRRGEKLRGHAQIFDGPRCGRHRPAAAQ